MSQPTVGLVERFQPGEYERAETLIEKATALHISDLRLAICWADWHTSEGDGWYAWLLPRLARHFQLLPCFRYTPPSLGIAPKFSSPPRSPKAYADFLDVMITRFGSLFEWLELWNHPTDDNEWDTRLDPDWQIFSEMVGGAAYRIRQRGKKTVLPGLWPMNLQWLELMSQRGILPYVDAIGVHGFPSSPEFGWRGWQREIEDVQKCLGRLKINPEIWITETGFSTWRDDEQSQISAMADAISAPVGRVYWRELLDRSSTVNTFDASRSDERDFHYGLLRGDGRSKLLYRRWAESGLKQISEAVRVPVHAQVTNPRRQTLITGGAGFIGTNLAERLIRQGDKVTIYDDLSRAGVEQNLAWLQQNFAADVEFDGGDIRDAVRVRQAVSRADKVFHLAAQVAVTTSLVNPREDFEINVEGTLNVLEAIRAMDTPPPLIFTSTNKVYGELHDLKLERNCSRYQPVDAVLRSGVGEDRSLAFHSPYGCSKGAADQYVLDYARTYGIPAVVFRMSCIYGPHQMGTEDQGWIAHFLIRAMHGLPITICGDGMQVRDVLFVEDLVDAFLLAQANIATLSGQAFNIGGGLGNTISLIELLRLIEGLEGTAPMTQIDGWRAGDQRYYVSDTRKFKAATGWAARVSVQEGVALLHRWLREASEVVQNTSSAAGGRNAILAG